MPVRTCPSCQADIEDDLFESVGSASCPFCGSDLASNGIDARAAADSIESRESFNDPPDWATGLPGHSKVQLVEATDRRRLVYIPAGGKRTAFIGGFAAVWIIFIAVFSGILLFAGGVDAPFLVVIPFLGLFWAVGLAMLIFWAKMRFTRVFLLVEPDRIVVQRHFLGRKTITETNLTPQSRAELAEAYRANDKPVYSVAVKGANRTAAFGTPLSLEEKKWLVDEINRFLGVADVGNAHGALDGGGLAAETVLGDAETDVPELDPHSTNLQPEIRVLEATHERLELQLPLVPSGKVRKLIAVFGILFTLLWCGATMIPLWGILQMRNAGAFEVLFALILGVFVLSATVPLFVICFLLAGKQTIGVSPETLTCRWHLGPVGPKKSIPVGSITHVVVANAMSVKRRMMGVRPQNPAIERFKASLVVAGQTLLPLTTFHRIEVAREVTGLVTRQLRRMGITLQDA